MSNESSPSERWYETVDIGRHVRALDGTPMRSDQPDRPVPQDVLRWFADIGPNSETAGRAPTLSPEGLRHFAALRAGLPAHEAEDHARDRAYQALDGPLEVFVRGFSEHEVRVWVLWATGGSRWHHYFDLVADLRVPRSADIDRRFGLEGLEAMYTLEACGVRHGMRVDEVIAALPGELLEYPGQSLQLRRIYAIECDLELVIQDSILKYLVRGDPGWLDGAMRLRGPPLEAR